MVFYIADMHFGHENVLRFDDRPFSEIGQMDETLVQNWNARVANDDRRICRLAGQRQTIKQ